MEKNKFKITKYACYMTGFTMSAVANISPLLFVTFRQLYGITYTMMGLLVVVNFATQLLIDLIFSFFTKYFNIEKTVKFTPLISAIGMVIYAVMPWLFPQQAYGWIVVGTVIASIGSGLAEVLMSPVIAAIPAENPEKEMSKLHSVYAWGVVAVVIISTLFLKLFGREAWMYLALLWSLVPFTATIMYLKADIPPMKIGGEEKGNKSGFGKGLWLCVLCIFFGGAAECTMSQWTSGFAEKALGISKVWGDVFGLALFGALLGIGRTAYARFGKNIEKVILWGLLCAFFCYMLAGFAASPAVALIACALTGICTSMLWPGSLIYTEEKIPGMSVAAYALMAAGGDLGASVAPQLVGVVADKIGATGFAAELGKTLNLTAEQIGMRSGLLIAGLFPLLGFITVLIMKKYFKRCKR